MALFILVSVVSYFIYWSKDQAVARFGQVFDATQDPVSNWGGKLGAVTANYIVGEWFGLFGICIPIVLIVLSLRIMRYRPMLLAQVGAAYAGADDSRGRSRSAIFSEMHGAFSEPGSVVRTGSMSPDGLIRSSAYWAPDCCWHWLS